MVVPLECILFSGMAGPEEMNTARGPFKQPAKGVVNGSLSLCVNKSQQSVGRFGHNKAVYPSLGFPTGLGTCPYNVICIQLYIQIHISKECWWLEAHTRDVTSSKQCLVMSHLRIQSHWRTSPNHRLTPPSHSHQTPLHPSPSFQRSHLFNCRRITHPLLHLLLPHSCPARLRRK